MRNIRKKKDIGIYGFVAKEYDRNSRKSRLPEMQSYANEVEYYVGKGANVLEVAPGPGYLSIELAKRGFHVTAVDISPDFVEIAKRNASEAAVSVNFLEGNVSNLPFQDCQFDFVVCSAAFKNFKDPVKALCEIHRVLKQKGKALIIDMNHEATNEDINEEVSNMKGFDRLFVKFSFKTFLKKGAYTKEEFAEFIKQSPFKNYHIRNEGISLYVYLDK
ncbi:class I SAM-dependent methyltransferase [Ureibacillus endophyticus]|uniref:Class I SAM-dependent methyltransferase n=1 Tax=Ureibacillus endophyticus TaxID=1978490 RepID=A0A494YXU7_9BACL|nr:class I SAM-dependent methyltransferase [Lysinibacillus endophyticus]RKQ14835.1 class I SAM-dependent methyltransferase [Lysinibacillus endophyticus]